MILNRKKVVMNWGKKLLKAFVSVHKYFALLILKKHANPILDLNSLSAFEYSRLGRLSEKSVKRREREREREREHSGTQESSKTKWGLILTIFLSSYEFSYYQY